MEIRQLRYFVAIYEAGSVTRASFRLRVAQSALSQQLAQLEDELGVQLFARSPQGVAPTAFGRIFYDHAREILQRLSTAVEAVRQLDVNPTGTVAIGMPETISVVLGLPLLQSAKLQFPNVKLRLTEDLSANLKEQLRDGRLDLAVVFDDGMNEELSVEPLVDEPLFLVGADHSAGGETTTLGDALSTSLILPDHRDGLRRMIASAASRAGIGAPNVVSEVNSLTVIRNAVLQGLGTTIVPMSCVASEVEQRMLKAQEIVDPPLRCRTVLATAHSALLNRVTASVFNLTVSAVQQLCLDRTWIGGSIARGTRLND